MTVFRPELRRTQGNSRKSVWRFSVRNCAEQRAGQHEQQNFCRIGLLFGNSVAREHVTSRPVVKDRIAGYAKHGLLRARSSAG